MRIGVLTGNKMTTGRRTGRVVMNAVKWSGNFVKILVAKGFQ
jgi:hypothetical protein